MTFEEAKTELKEGYVKAGFELVSDQDVELHLKFRKDVFVISEEEIKGYEKSKAVLSTLENIPVECSICGPTFREHLVRALDPIRGRFLVFPFSDYLFGEPSSDSLYIKVGNASALFVNYFRFNDSYLQLCKERLIRTYRPPSPDGRKYLKDYLFIPSTIQVFNISEPNSQLALKRSSELIDACLFGLSYAKNLHLRLLDEWPLRRERGVRSRFTFGGQVPGRNLPLPNATYNSDIVRFYQLGVSSDIPVLQFLAFYQVLEYFFIAISDEQLYAKLASRINDFKFRANPNNLDRIIQDVLEHNRSTDETEMLKSVLTKYVDEAELISFIQTYEDYLNDRHYTKKRDRFGVEIEVKLTPGHVMGNIAKIIKTVRNALVHSSDRHDRNIRHVPFSKSAEIVEREVPLVKFLAEKVITATAS